MDQRIWIVLLLLIQIVVHGQSPEMVFEPPSPDFISLSLQTHEGKLRFGNQDEYFLKSDGTYINSRDDGYFETDKRSSLNRASRHAFVELLKMRFKKEMFDAMDKTYFTERRQNMYEEEVKEYFRMIAKGNKYMLYNEESLISIDYKQIEESSIIDGQWIKVLDQNVLKIVLWYDNEWGYSSSALGVARLITEKQ